MSWLQQLYETYEACIQDEDLTKPVLKKNGSETVGLLPLSHISQQAHICITISQEGNFEGAELLPPKVSYVVPATEDSAGRAGKKASPHPLADKIHYCAQDYKGGKENYFSSYANQLKAWCESSHSHPKAKAVYAYISKGCVVRDLVEHKLLFKDNEENLLTKVPEDFKDKDTIFKRTIKDQGDVFILWRVHITNDKEPCTWKDKTLHEAWHKYDLDQEKVKTLCMLSGEAVPIMTKHPRNLRRPGDGAKLVSSNDKDGFTFLGRFTGPEEVCTIGYKPSNKAHNALRWIIERQGYKSGDQVIVAWAPNGVAIPQPCTQWLNSFDDDELLDVSVGEELSYDAEISYSDLGQSFASSLTNALRGYRADLKNTTGISIIGLDSASPGRLSVIFYRSQLPQEYLDKLEAWQSEFVWFFPKKGQDKKMYTVAFAPIPKDIARVAYGQRADEKLLKATVERLLPCIVDGAPFPYDIVESCYRRACQRVSLDTWEWPLVLGTACAVYKGYYARHPQQIKRREYTMSLDEARTTRDYLYGRLLAVAEYLERKAMPKDEKRPTNAERLLTRFADRPFSTWRTIEIQLNPYLQRLQSNHQGSFVYGNKLLQNIYDIFNPNDFADDNKLSGEFLLGYHCQMSALYTSKNKETIETAQGDSHE